jgi:hypothetical protein
MEQYTLTLVACVGVPVIAAFITRWFVKRGTIKLPAEYIEILNKFTWDNLVDAYREADTKAADSTKRTAFASIIQKLAKDRLGYELSDHTLNFIREYVVALCKLDES